MANDVQVDIGAMVDESVREAVGSIRETNRKTFGLKMIGSAPLGTRLYDASGLTFAAGVNDGKSVSNGFDLMPIYAGMDKVMCEPDIETTFAPSSVSLRHAPQVTLP